MKYWSPHLSGSRPTTASGWWTIWLGTAAVVTAVLMPIIALGVLPSLLTAGDQVVAAGIGFGLGILEMLLVVSTLLAGSLALASGERSPLVWLALVPSVLIAVFGLFLLIGELIISP